ncbi:hypothetical protein LBMAG21_15990 [Armatimonadota bacterium]|nr:hypothetical protein LBMAG21_15990 [Armatimonadota bacterium]
MSTGFEVQVRTVEVYSAPAQFLIRRLCDELAVMYDTPSEEVEWYFQEIKPVERGVFAVAFSEGEPIGCGAIRPYIEDAQVAEVKRVYVEPLWRKRGVARLVMLALEVEAQNLGYRKMQLETGNIQVAAIRLYESLGYQHCTCFGHYANDPLSVCFEKILPTE